MSPNGTQWFAALPGTLHVKCCWKQEPQAVPDTFERLKAALADRYAMEREAEPPASTSEKHPHEGGAP